ncbi:hypothetical protein B0H13DRAFT_1882329 [Mycena leptocephala]|nr:hypothetical protein B0H13DRAFT_1882329 [Mycena leptocephala]
MSPQPASTHIRLKHITTCLAITVNTLEILADSIQTPFLAGISNTTQSLLKSTQTIKQNKDDCSQLMEQAHGLLNAIIMVEIITECVEEYREFHRVFIFPTEWEQSQKLFRQAQMSTLLKDCKVGLQQGLDFFQIKTVSLIADITQIQQDAQERHQEVLKMIVALSDVTSSDGASSVGVPITVSKKFADIFIFQSSNSISMLPAEPTIFHGRESELLDILRLFSQETPRIAILETLWEPAECRGDVEEFLSLLTDVDHLALMVDYLERSRETIQSAVDPAIFAPFKPLAADAARRMFIDIADNIHNTEEVNKVLALTDNMPLAISLIANFVDQEGCPTVLSRWEKEKTSLMSEGYDRRDNLELSISLSLSSPRMTSQPHSQELLSLLSMLPDGLSDLELVQSKFPTDYIHGCKVALIRTALAYIDEHKRLKNILFNGLQHGHPDLVNSIYCVCYLHRFSLASGRGPIPLIDKIHDILPKPCDHRLEAYFITELFNSWREHPIPDPETLITKVLAHFEHFDDPDLKCKFYRTQSYYQLGHNQNISTAIDLCQSSLSLAVSTGNTKRRTAALNHLAWMRWRLGHYSVAQRHAQESQQLTRISADLYKEAVALQVESMCWTALGSYQHSIPPSNRARALLALCGMTGGSLDRNSMTSQAEVHRFKSEYVDARNIHLEILREPSIEHDPYIHALALHNLAEIDVQIGAPQNDVQKNIDLAKSIFSRIGYVGPVIWCDVFKQSSTSGKEIWWVQTHCSKGVLEYPGGKILKMSPTVWRNLAILAVGSKQKLGIHKALKFLGDASLADGDGDTAVSLFTIALEGFTHMDVHRSRAECMLQLEIFPKDMVKEVEKINERLAVVNNDVLEQHRNNLARLAELNAPSGIVQELEDASHLSENEDLEKLDSPGTVL